MGQEIERKFLVTGDAWRDARRGSSRIRQGYICRGREAIVRVRTIGARAFLTIKSNDPGAVRVEYEYEIPNQDAEHLLTQMCAGALIEKTRHDIEWGGVDWIVDEFEGAHTGLVMAERELNFADQDINIPPWAGQEVTDIPEYRNDRLSLRSPMPRGRNDD